MKKVHFLLPLFFILFFSCSQNLPELNSVSGTAVFEYENGNELPDFRLGVYIDVSSDVHRVEKIRLVCLENDFQWECVNPVKVESGKKKYAGYSDFVMPEKDIFPMGKYMVWYTDANGNEENSILNLAFSQEIYEKTASEASEYLKNHNGTENWAVFDENSVLIFYGEREFTLGVEDLWYRFPTADFVRTVWTRSNGREICILPAVYKNPLRAEIEKNESDDFDESEDEDALKLESFETSIDLEESEDEDAQELEEFDTIEQ
ncbi:MAG: hypothetical protein MJ182_07465 [Treponema sp.]|nr:hypothetical protein [Treponema sp.]